MDASKPCFFPNSCQDEPLDVWKCWVNKQNWSYFGWAWPTSKGYTSQFPAAFPWKLRLIADATGMRCNGCCICMHTMIASIFKDLFNTGLLVLHSVFPLLQLLHWNFFSTSTMSCKDLFFLFTLDLEQLIIHKSNFIKIHPISVKLPGFLLRLPNGPQLTRNSQRALTPCRTQFFQFHVAAGGGRFRHPSPAATAPVAKKTSGLCGEDETLQGAHCRIRVCKIKPQVDMICKKSAKCERNLGMRLGRYAIIAQNQKQ